jgi:hypothetical protein
MHAYMYKKVNVIYIYIYMCVYVHIMYTDAEDVHIMQSVAQGPATNKKKKHASDDSSQRVCG